MLNKKDCLVQGGVRGVGGYRKHQVQSASSCKYSISPLGLVTIFVDGRGKQQGSGDMSVFFEVANSQERRTPF